MQITLIRHLPTEWNKQQILQGRRNIPIAEVTADLWDHIEENRQYVRKMEPFELVLASTLIRTQQTAHLYGYDPEPDRLVDELDFGSFEGKAKQELMNTFGNLWIEHPKDLVLGESLQYLERRIELFLEKYKEIPNILVFGHGAWIRAMISYWQTGDINQMNKIIVGNNQCISLP